MSGQAGNAAPAVGTDPDREAIFGGLYTRLVQFFTYKNWSGPRDLPQDLAQETLTRGLARIAEGVELQADPLRYFWGVARNVELEYLRAAKKAGSHTTVDEQLPDPVDGAVAIDRRLQVEQLLTGLPEEDRRLFVAYYLGDRADLHTPLGISPGALRVRVHRIRRQLDRMISDGAAAARKRTAKS